VSKCMVSQFISLSSPSSPLRVLLFCSTEHPTPSLSLVSRDHCANAEVAYSLWPIEKTGELEVGSGNGISMWRLVAIFKEKIQFRRHASLLEISSQQWHSLG